MATKTDFTEEEWKTMQKGVTGAGILVSVSDRDFTDSFGEMGALAKTIAAQRESSDSAFIRELADVHGTGFGLTGSQEAIEKETLDALRSAVEILTAKAPDELDAYRKLVVGVGDAVAAAKSGTSAAESAALEAVKQAVGA